MSRSFAPELELTAAGLIAGAVIVIGGLDVRLWRKGRPTVSVWCGQRLVLVGLTMLGLFLHFVGWQRLLRLFRAAG